MCVQLGGQSGTGDVYIHRSSVCFIGAQDHAAPILSLLPGTVVKTELICGVFTVIPLLRFFIATFC